MIASAIDDEELNTENILPDALDRTIPYQISQSIQDKFSKLI